MTTLNSIGYCNEQRTGVVDLLNIVDKSTTYCNGAWFRGLCLGKP